MENLESMLDTILANISQRGKLLDEDGKPIDKDSWACNMLQFYYREVNELLYVALRAFEDLNPEHPLSQKYSLEDLKANFSKIKKFYSFGDLIFSKN